MAEFQLHNQLRNQNHKVEEIEAILGPHFQSPECLRYQIFFHITRFLSEPKLKIYTPSRQKANI